MSWEVCLRDASHIKETSNRSNLFQIIFISKCQSSQIKQNYDTRIENKIVTQYVHLFFPKIMHSLIYIIYNMFTANFTLTWLGLFL